MDPGDRCDRCGREARDAGETLTWTRSVERDGERRYCTECSRANLRSIEGRLDSEWW